MASRIKSGKSQAVRARSVGVLTRDKIVDCALHLSKKVPLQDISIMRIAGELGVTRGSVHYHLETRDDLVAAVFNRFHEELLTIWPQQTGDWQVDVKVAADVMYRQFLTYSGISAYFASQNRFRLLLSALEQNATGPTLAFYDRLFSVVREVGLDSRSSATYASLLIQFAHTCAHHTAGREWPGHERKLEKYFSAANTQKFASVAFIRDDYIRIDGDEAFDKGLGLLLAGLQKERDSLL